MEKKGISNLWKNEDWLAVWIGFLIIILSIVLFKGGTDLKKLAPGFKWTTDSQVTSRAEKWTKIIDGTIPEAEAKGEIGAVNRLQALKEAIGKGDDRRDIAKAAEKVQTLGGKPGAIGKEIAGHAKNVPGKIFTGENIGKVI
ncbi:MAG: putative sulfate exporter family transporter, partial [Nitrospirae bacterium]|nr:putative sulfate exporter family transporter [Nitrospirota bacterium]